MSDLLQSIRSNRRALARLLTRVEDGQAASELSALYPHTGKAQIIGMTGAPGTGKSTLTSALARYYRTQNQRVGIIAVDPSSPFSGGAILGDRIRMNDLSGDPGIFIRSVATRGNLGGLSRTTTDMIRVLDAAGFEVILVETVGAGQGEVDIAHTAQTTLVIEAPGLGDDIQAIKAGILEIADILVVNKADQPGAENTVRALRAMLDLGHPVDRTRHHGQVMNVEKAENESASLWLPPIVQTVAVESKGIDVLAQAIVQHQEYLKSTGILLQRDRAQIETEILEHLREMLLARLMSQVNPAEMTQLVDRATTREINPFDAATRLMDHEK